MQKRADIAENSENDLHILVEGIIKQAVKIPKLKQLILDTLQSEGIPVSIFSHQLSALEALVKFLKENQCMKISQIATQLNRKPQTISTSYSNAKKKFPKPLPLPAEDIQIPLEIFRDRSRSVLEHIVTYLKEQKNIRLSDIARLLGKDPRTIWTVYNRKRKKHD